MSTNFWSRNLEKIKKLALIDLDEKKINLKDELDFNVIEGDYETILTKDYAENYKELYIHIQIIMKQSHYYNEGMIDPLCKKIIDNPDLYNCIMKRGDNSVLCDIIKEYRHAR